MDNPLSSLSFVEIEEVMWHRRYSQHLTIAGLCIILYDCVLTSVEEWDIIWTKRWNIPKVFYIINRYGMVLITIYYLGVIGLWFDFNAQSCEKSAVVVVILSITVDTAGNAIILDRLLHLWESSGIMTWLMASGFVIMHALMVGFAAAAAKVLREHGTHIGFGRIQSCYSPTKPDEFIGVYASYVAMDVYAFALLLGNALSRPRNENEHLLSLLYGDGMIFFMICLSMHTFNLANTMISPPTLLLLSINFGGTMVANAVARLYLRLGMEKPARSTRLELYSEETELQPRGTTRGGHSFLSAA